MKLKELKNLENTIKWFIEEFIEEEVGLVVKTNYANCSTADFMVTKHKMSAIARQFPDRKCKIYLIVITSAIHMSLPYTGNIIVYFCC